MSKIHTSSSLQSEYNDIKEICCIGAGYVGGPTMAVIASKCPHLNVTVVDIDQKRIDQWNSNKYVLNHLLISLYSYFSKSPPIFEPGLLDIVQESRGRNLFFSTNVKETIQKAQVIFVAVNTPTKVKGFGVCLIATIITMPI